MLAHIFSSRVDGSIQARRRMRPVVQMSLESLEERTLLTTLLVDIADATCAADGPIYCEIRDALGAAMDGDTIQVHTGAYQPISIEKNDITIEPALPESVPLIDAESKMLNAIESLGDRVTIRGLTLKNGAWATLIIFGEANTIIGNTVEGWGATGIAAGNDGHLIEGNTVIGKGVGVGLGVIGIELVGATNTVVRGNTVSDTTGGYLICGIGSVVEDNVAIGNRVGFGHNCFSDDMVSHDNELVGNRAEDSLETGFSISNTSHNVTMRGNTSIGGQVGFDVQATTTESVLIGNVAVNNSVFGIQLQSASSEMDTFEYNECRDNGMPDNKDGTLCLAIGDGHVVGDVNGDTTFNSTDLIIALASGKYESGTSANYVEGDWDGDGLFTSSDLIVASAEGHFVADARAGLFDTAAVIDAVFGEDEF